MKQLEDGKLNLSDIPLDKRNEEIYMAWVQINGYNLANLETVALKLSVMKL